MTSTVDLNSSTNVKILSEKQRNGKIPCQVGPQKFYIVPPGKMNRKYIIKIDHICSEEFEWLFELNKTINTRTI